MRPHFTVPVLAVLLAAAPRGAAAQHPRGTAAQHAHNPVAQPETLALAVKHSSHAATAAPTPAVVGGSDPAHLLRRSAAPLPARSMTVYLCDEARDAIMQGMLMANDDARLQSYVDAEKDARQALATSPASLDARYWVAAAEGMRAGFGGLRHRLRLGEDVYHLAQSILEADPSNAGGHYLMGRLNIEIMTMGGLARFIAGDLLGASLIRQASWGQAEQHLLAAVKGEPRNAMDRLALARVYAATGQNVKARAQIQTLLDDTDRTPITPLVEAQARALLRSLPPAN